MGKLRRIMITGASGFIGQATVDEALRRGQEVVAVVRRNSPSHWAGDARIQVVQCDLSDPSSSDQLADAMEVDAVIHAAAHLGSDSDAHHRDSVLGTEHLLHAMTISGLKRLVLVSSIAVYDTSQTKAGSNITETSPLEDIDTPRDAYVQGKLAQEGLCERAADRRGINLAILRPGAVFGPNRTWNAHIGVGLGPVLIGIGNRRGEVPVCHISTCAQTLVAAALNEADGVFNIIDDQRPSRRRYLKAHKKSGWPKLIFFVNWRLVLLAGLLAGILPGRKPGLLRPDVLKARNMPLHYPNTKMRNAFDIPPSPAFEDLMAQSIAGSNQ